jgi:tetratricopeptide (TPR) repeat protein
MPPRSSSARPGRVRGRHRTAASARAWFWRPGLALFLAGVLAIKLIVMWQLHRHPLLQPDAGLDTSTYVQLARRVLSGDLALGPGLYYMSPLYIYFLSAALALHNSFTFVRAIQMALGTAAVGCIYLSAREWFGPRAAWIAAGLAVLTGLFTFYEILLLQASLDVFLTAAALACLALALRPRPTDGSRDVNHWSALLAGGLFGLQALNRPNVLVAAGGILLVLLVLRRARLAALIVAGLLLALAPVVIRNAIVARQFALVSSQGGLNFYIGNHATATGQYVAVPGVRASIEGQSEDTRRVAEQAVGHPLSDAEVSAYFTGVATAWIREHPVAAARLFARKLALVFSVQHQWLDLSYPYYARDVESWLGALIVGPWLLVPLGLMGLAIAPPDGRRADFAVWASFVPWYAAGVALFFVAERYRLPMFVPLCVGAGGAVDGVVRALSVRRLRPLAVPLAVLLAAVVVSNLPFRLDNGRYDERLRLAKVLMNRREYDEAAMELAEAHRINPGNTGAEFNLGMALVSAGRPAEGIPHIRHAVDAGVAIDGARYALASAMRASGDAEGSARLLRTFRPEPADGAESCFQVGLLALDVSAPDVAERYFRQAVALRPGWVDARQQLGQLLAGAGRFTEAASELQAAIDAGSRDPAAYANLAYCDAKLGRIEDARRAAAIVRQIDPAYNLGPLQSLLGGR